MVSRAAVWGVRGSDQERSSHARVLDLLRWISVST